MVSRTKRRSRSLEESGKDRLRDATATAKQYYEKAYEVGWASAIKASPTYGPQMKKLFSK